MIPKIIHNIWIQGYMHLPNEIKIKHLNIKKLNLEWEFIIWDNNMILNLLKQYPSILKIYENINYLSGFISNEVTKSDIARYVIMKEYGGLYCDIEIDCISSFNDIFTHKEQKNDIYISSSNIELLDYIYPFYKPKYCSCFMAMEKNHPIWNKVFKTIENTQYKNIIKNALDKELQFHNIDYNIIIMDKVNGYYQCIDKDKVCFIKASSNNYLTPIIKYFNCYYKQTFLFIFSLLIIIFVEKLYHYNTSIYGSINYIPGFGAITQSAPNKNENKQHKKRRL